MTFTLKQSLSASGSPGADFCHDDERYIYYLDYDGSDEHVYRLDTSTNTVTKISENASFTGVLIFDNFRGPVYFSNAIYVLTEDGSDIRVYEWTGSGTNWTLRETISYADVAFGQQAGIQPIGSQLVVAVYDDGDTSTGELTLQIRYSVDGSTWLEGSYDAAPEAPAATYQGFGLYFYNQQNHPNGLWISSYANDAALPNHFLYALYKWNAATANFDYTGYYYQKDHPDFAGNDWVADIEYTDTLNWYESAQEYEQETLTGTGTSPNTASVNPVKTIGFTTKSIGYWVTGGDLNFYIMDPVGTWDDGEQIASLTNGAVLGVVRFTQTGDTWLFYEPSSGANQIYQRDDPIEDSAAYSATGSFYYGVNELTQRSDLPFSKASMRGMDVNSLNQIVVPNVAPNDYMVAAGQLETLYQQWKDITYDIGQDVGLEVLRWV